MCSHIDIPGVETEWEPQEWVQNPVFHVCLETVRPKPTSALIDMADPTKVLQWRTAYIYEHTNGSKAGLSKSACLHRATTPHMCERCLRL